MTLENEPNTILRTPTEKEKEDFIVIGQDTPENEMGRIKDIISFKITSRNRSILIKSQNPIEDFKKLSCPGCFSREFEHNLIGEDFEDNFKRYSGRLKLAEVKKTAHQHSLYRESGFAMIAERCAYCNKIHSYSFQSSEFNEDQIKLLTKESNKSSGEE